MLSIFKGPSLLEIVPFKYSLALKVTAFSLTALIFVAAEVLPLIDMMNTTKSISTVQERVDSIEIPLGDITEPMHLVNWMTSDSLLASLSDSLDFLCHYPEDKHLLCAKVTCERSLGLANFSYASFKFTSIGILSDW